MDETPRCNGSTKTPAREERHDVSSVLNSAVPTSPSCNPGQVNVSWSVPDGDLDNLFNPHERNRFVS